MFHAFTTRRLSRGSTADGQATPPKLSRSCHLGAVLRTASKPPLCPKPPARSPNSKSCEDAGRDFRVVGRAQESLLSGTKWQQDYLRFGREVIQSGDQIASRLLRKRRRSSWGSAGDKSGEMEDASMCELCTSAQQDEDLVAYQMTGLRVDQQPRNRGVQNPFTSPKGQPLRRRLSASSLRKTPDDRGSAGDPPVMTLGGAIAGNVDEVDVKGLTEILPNEERVAWQAFAPLHRVLIVAIAAAASANLQRHDVQEKGRLQRAVEARDHALALMRQQIGHLLGGAKGHYLLSQQRDTAACFQSSPSRFAEASDIKPAIAPPSEAEFSLGSVSPSPPPRLYCESPLLNEKQPPRLLEGSRSALETKRQKGRTDLSASFESVVARAVMSGGKGLRESMELVKGALQSQLTSGKHLARNDKSKSLVRSAGSLSEVDPNLVHLRTPPQKGQHDLAAKCAAVIGQAKDAAVAVLNREAAAVLAALVVVVRTAAVLETGQQTGDAKEESSAGADLRLAVESATARIVSLQEAVSATWHSLGPAAQAALQGSAAGKGQHPESSSLPVYECTTPRQSLCAPNGGFLRTSLRASSSGLPSPFQSLHFPEGTFKRSCESVSKMGRQSVESAQQLTAMVETAVHRAVDGMMSQTEEAPTRSTESEAGKELVAELEKEAAKMAGMEEQLAALQEELRASNESKQVLSKELEAAQNEHARTQLRMEQEARDLESELMLRDCAIGELRRSHAVVVAAKDGELKLKRDQMAELHMELQETEALLGLAGSGEKHWDQLERACRDKDSRTQALELQVSQLKGQVASQELQLKELRQPAPASSTNIEKNSASETLVDDHRPESKDLDTSVEGLADLPRQSVLRSSTSSSDVLLDNMSDYSQDYHLTDQAIADMIESLRSPPRKSNVKGTRSPAKGEKALTKVRLSSGSFKKSGSKDVSKGRDGSVSKKRRWI